MHLDSLTNDPKRNVEIRVHRDASPQSMVGASLDMMYMILAVRDSILLLTEEWQMSELYKEMVGRLRICLDLLFMACMVL